MDKSEQIEEKRPPLLSKTFDRASVEKKWYGTWIEKGYFHATPDIRDSFTIVIPPPNVTGALHMGHAFNNTLQDILIRYKRMDGVNTLWMPGTDHAGIATQNVVEKMLAAEGIDRHKLGREAFVKRVWEWKEQSGGIILNQLKRLGSSCDWERERFTMDEGLSNAVREVFVRLYSEGLIYKGDRLINWCPRCHTALSDLEVEHKDRPGALVHIAYPIVDGDGEKTGETITIATTRPETMLGDSAVAVHPEDDRYISFIGKSLLLPLTGRTIPVIADKYVDKSFGTGALKITPAHDPNDFEIGNRHKLDTIKVIDEEGKICGDVDEYTGLDRYDCRKKIVSDLREGGFLVKEEPYTHAVGECYRCQTAIEPSLSKQWFVKIKPLAEPAIAAVREKRIRIIPETWQNTYYSWMENINDWCISRQIWWGHRIPAWLCQECGQFTVEKTDPDSCSHCGSKSIEQETDVLDTWFSSALWPFSTLGWPEKTEELKCYYPTSVLITGFDILFFWVARMIMMGLKFMGEVPFKDVYIHALVRDASGQKMSKSKGNIIDPLTIMDKFGTDAFRFTLAAMAAQGRDVKLSEERIEGYRNFVNKIWNAFRFIFCYIDEDLSLKKSATLPSRDSLHLADRWIISRLHQTIIATRKGLEHYRFNDASNVVYQFFWHELCDWYIELVKSRLQSEGEDKDSAIEVLVYLLETSLRMLHPFMPFITEELWQKLPHEGESITLAAYPVSEETLIDEQAEKELGLVMDLCRCVRTIRGEVNIPPSRHVNVILKISNRDVANIISKNIDSVKELSRLESVTIDAHATPPKIAAGGVTGDIEVFVLLDGVINKKEETSRITKEMEKIDKEIMFIEKKLSNKSFVDKAPVEVVKKNMDKLAELKDSLSKLEQNLERIV